MFFIKVILDIDAQILTLDANLSPKTIVVISQITTSTKKKTQENIQGKCDSKISRCVVSEDAMGKTCV
jgi:predicted nucleic acid-binding protein